MEKRLFQAIKSALLSLVLGLTYYFAGTFTGWYLPCFFHKVTGLYCPGCGVTRMIVALLHGNLREAFYSNMLLFVLLPVLAVLFLIQIIRFIWTGSVFSGTLWNCIYSCILVLLLIFGLLRNLPYFYDLRPGG